MKKQTLVISAIAALIAVSCTKSEQPGVQIQSEYIRPIASIATTRALVSDNSAVLTDLKFLHKMDVAGLTDPGISFASLTPIDGSRAATGAITLTPAQPYDKVGDKTSYLLGYTGTDANLAANKVTWTNTGIIDILTTNSWEAGTYLVPKTTGMTLRHALSRIEVICAANSASDLDVIKGTWGNITSIKFKDAPTTLVLDCTNNTTAAGVTKANLPLNSGNTYTAVGFTPAPIEANGSTTVMASAMIPPTELTTCKLIVSSALMPDVEVDVEFKDAQNVAIPCKPGIIHLITLNFNVKDKTIQAQTTTITEWTIGGTSQDPVNPPPSPAIGS